MAAVKEDLSETVPSALWSEGSRVQVAPGCTAPNAEPNDVFQEQQRSLQ